MTMKWEGKKKVLSPAGNRTRVFRVTGGDTYHYTTEDLPVWSPKFYLLLPLQPQVLVMENRNRQVCDKQLPTFVA